MLCDIQLPEGWYRFVEAARTKMPTTRVPAFRCYTDSPGRLVGTDPTMGDGKVHRTVCFINRDNGCKYSEKYKIKNIKTKQNKQTNKQKTENVRKKSEILIFWTNRSLFSMTTDKITCETER